MAYRGWETYQIVRHEKHGSVIRGVLDLKQHDAPNYWRDAEKDESRPLSFRPCRESCSTKSSHYLDSTKWDIEENRMEGVKSKSFHDQRTECGDAATGNSADLSVSNRPPTDQ